MAQPPHPPGPQARVRDPQVLRALAHPLRTRLLGLLRLDGPSTASRLGARVGESSGVTSYHLRQLAQHGFVTELADRGTRRERWWQAAHTMTSWEPDELLDQPGGQEVGEQMQRLQVEHIGRELRRWVDAGRVHGPEWARAAGMSDYLLRLPPEQTRQLLEELYAVLDRWSADTLEPAPWSTAVSVFAVAVPRTDPS